MAEAKKQVFGRVSIDMIAGPSEILILADDTCDAEIVAADMLSQAEHDTMASAVLVTDSERLADAVSAELERQIPLLPRAEIARESIDNCSKIILAESMTQAVEISNELLRNIWKSVWIILLRICRRFAMQDLFSLETTRRKLWGTILQGQPYPAYQWYSRFSSPLSVDDFIKKSSFTYYTQQALEQVGEKIVRFAEEEGLQAHGKSVSVRLEKGGTL